MSLLQNDSLWSLLSLLSCFIYNIIAFRFSRRILKNFTKKKVLIPICSAINTVAVMFYVSLQLPFPLLFLFGVCVFYIEFSILSRATTIQKIFGASVFFFHIGSIHLLVLIVHAYILDVTIIELFKTSYAYSQSWFLTCIVLMLVLLILQEKIPISDIKRVSCAKSYTKYLVIITLAILVLLTLESFLILRAEEIEFAEVISLGTIIFTAAIFYFFFLYSIHFINMYVYKRKKDAIVDTHTQLLIEKQRIEQEITRDSLTSLYTKKFAYEVLQTLCTTKDAMFAVLFIDLNGLKYVNDTYGHEIGDAYICKVSSLIKSEIREDDIAARIGGDELLIIMEATDSDEVDQIVERIQERAKIQDSKEKYIFSISIGVVCIDNKIQMKNFDTILSLADENMRQKKREYYKEVGKK